MTNSVRRAELVDGIMWVENPFGRRGSYNDIAEANRPPLPPQCTADFFPLWHPAKDWPPYSDGSYHVSYAERAGYLRFVGPLHKERPHVIECECECEWYGPTCS